MGEAVDTEEVRLEVRESGRESGRGRCSELLAEVFLGSRGVGET